MVTDRFLITDDMSARPACLFSLLGDVQVGEIGAYRIESSYNLICRGQQEELV